LIGLLFRLFSSVATHYINKYTRIPGKIELKLSTATFVLDLEQGVVYTLRRVVSTNH